MKLIIVVVEDDDAPILIKNLATHDYRSTKLASTGGFLLQGNTTLLVGVENEQVEDVLEIIRETCKRRKKIVPHATAEIPTTVNLPIEIEVGGAIVFVVNIVDFYRI